MAAGDPQNGHGSSPSAGAEEGLGGVMGAVGARMAKNAATRSIPSTDDLRDAGSAAYKAAEKAGLVVKSDSFDNAVDKVVAKATKAGIDKDIHPKATAALNRLIEGKGGEKSLAELDRLRRIAGAAAKSNEPDERRIAMKIIDKLDDYMLGLKPSDVSAGDPLTATQSLTKARDLWSRMRKGEIVENLIERAGTRAGQFSGSGYENALRTEFRGLAMNPKRMRGFTADEKAAIKKVATGGPIENALRLIGKMAPRGVVSGAFNLAVSAAGSPALGAATMMAGEAGRRAATAMSAANAQRAAQLMRAGGSIPQVTALSGPRRALLESMLIGGTQQLPQLPYGMLANSLDTSR